VLSFNKIRLNAAQGGSLHCNLIAGNFELLVLAPNFKNCHIFKLLIEINHPHERANILLAVLIEPSDFLIALQV
jgi:hypothetical protein